MSQSPWDSGARRALLQSSDLRAVRQRTAYEIGQLIRNRRLALGFTQDLIAARLGVEPHTVRRWEYGDMRPRDKNMAALMTLLGLTAQDLADAEMRAWNTPLQETA